MTPRTVCTALHRVYSLRVAYVGVITLSVYTYAYGMFSLFAFSAAVGSVCTLFRPAGMRTVRPVAPRGGSMREAAPSSSAESIWRSGFIICFGLGLPCIAPGLLVGSLSIPGGFLAICAQDRGCAWVDRVILEQLSWRAEAATVSANVQCALISGRQLQQQDRRPIRARVARRVSALRSFQFSSQGVRQSRACSVRLVPGSQNHAERAMLWARRRVWQRRGVRGGVKLACVHGRCWAAFAVAGLRAQARPASLTGRAWAGRRQAWDRRDVNYLFLDARGTNV